MLTAQTEVGAGRATGLYDTSLPAVLEVYWRAIARGYAGRRARYRVKRALDLLLAASLLLALSPLMLLIAVAIKLTSRGPVFYRQKRLMRGGWPFTLYKFRTMVVGADAMVSRAFDDPVVGALFKSKRQARDPRVTAVGRLLRATFLDELPQLVNVLRGEMSFVGPRPCQPYEAEHMPREFTVRFAVPQGLTGPWQVQRHRHEAQVTRQVHVEAAYVDSWSLSQDFLILLKTVPLVLARGGV